MSEVYSIYLEEENEEILSAIDKLWKERVFKVNNSYVFISSNEKTTTAAIMDKLRACSSAGEIGVIIVEVSNIGGFYYSSFWEWKNKFQ